MSIKFIADPCLYAYTFLICRFLSGEKRSIINDMTIVKIQNTFFYNDTAKTNRNVLVYNRIIIIIVYFLREKTICYVKKNLI